LRDAAVPPKPGKVAASSDQTERTELEQTAEEGELLWMGVGLEDEAC